MPTALLWNIHLPVTVALSAIASLGYLVSSSRNRRPQFTLLDFVTIILLMVIVTITGVPMVEAAVAGAQEDGLAQSLQTLRGQIELYKRQHNGLAPVLYQGTLPQLAERTDATGMPGPKDGRHPLGPYLPAGIPANPITGRSVVTATDTFPPTAASGHGGWLYHEPSGQIAPDVPDMLDR
jgi:general secretion pathway protein G